MMKQALRRDPEIGFAAGRREIAESGPWVGLPPTAFPRESRLNSASDPADLISGLRRRLTASADTFDALAHGFASCGEPLLSQACVSRTVAELFDFDPLCETAASPVIIVGAQASARRRTALAIARRIRRGQRPVALFSLDVRGFDTVLPVRRHAEAAFPVQPVNGIDACRSLIESAPRGALVLIESTGHGSDEGAEALHTLRDATGGEIVFAFDGNRDGIGEHRPELGIRRFVGTTRLDRPSFGPALDLAYARAWAFGGLAAQSGLFHHLDADTLSERFLNVFGAG